MKNCRFCDKKLAKVFSKGSPIFGNLYDCANCISKNFPCRYPDNEPFFKIRNGYSQHYVSVENNKITVEEWFVDKPNGALHIVNFETDTYVETYINGSFKTKWYPLMDFFRVEKLLAFM